MTQANIDLLALVEDARKLRPATKRLYNYAVRKWLDFAGPDPANWTLDTCQAFYDGLVNTDGLGVTSAGRILSGGVSFALKRASDFDPSIVDVTKKVDRYKKTFDADDDGKRHALTSPQVQALLRACEGSDLVSQRDRAIVVISLFTGLRRMSVTSLDLGAVVDKGAHVTLRAQLKGGHWDRIPLDKRAWAMTSAYREALAAVDTRRGQGHDALFPRFVQKVAPGRAGIVMQLTPTTRLTPDGLYKTLIGRAQTAGIKAFHPHIFRHTFVSWCRAAKVEDYLVEVITRHRGSTSLVNRVYTDKELLESDVARRCYEAIAERLAR